MKILIIAEHDQQKLKSSTHHTVTAATKLGKEIDILVVGSNCQSVAKQAAQLTGIQKVWVADNTVYEHQLAENVAELVVSHAKEYDYLLAPATTFGKNLLPRVAALLDVSMMSDVIEVVSANTFVRPIYAGNVMATVQSDETIRLMTIRTTAFVSAEEDQQHHAEINVLNDVIETNLSRFESHVLTQSKRPELTSARVIISGGRGLKSAENFQLLETIADKLGAAIGASRAAVDAGFAPNDYQVGQTGKVVAPDLYIAVGISGAIQHLAGMKDSKVIVAINSDPEAPIFQIADYGLVGDLFKLLPEIQTELDKI